MNTLFVFALLVAGTQAGNLYHAAPAVAYAATPVAVASPVLTATYPAYSVHSPIAHHVDSTYAAPAPAVLAAPAIYAAPAVVKTHHVAAAPVYAGAIGYGSYGGLAFRK